MVGWSHSIDWVRGRADLTTQHDQLIQEVLINLIFISYITPPSALSFYGGYSDLALTGPAIDPYTTSLVHDTAES